MGGRCFEYTAPTTIFVEWWGGTFKQILQSNHSIFSCDLLPVSLLTTGELMSSSDHHNYTRLTLCQFPGIHYYYRL